MTEGTAAIWYYTGALFTGGIAMSRFSTAARRAGALAWALGAPLALSQPADAAAPPDPHQIIGQRTAAIIEAAEEAQAYFAEEPERFYAEVLALLEDVVDFRSFARNVMGEHASRQRLRQLSPTQRQQLGDHLHSFTEVSRDSLVKTYARALLTVVEKDIALLPPSQPVGPKDRKAQVVQRVSGGDGEPLLIKYSVRRNPQGQWMLANLIVNDINLGKLYRNQFRNAMKKYNGDMAKVIANWQATSDTRAEGS